MALDHREVETAVAAVAGVASATVRPSASGRARLRITLAPGGDADVVSHDVSDVLRSRFGLLIDPSAIRPRPAGSEDAGLDDGASGDPPDDAAEPRSAPEPAADARTAPEPDVDARTAPATEPAAAPATVPPPPPQSHESGALDGSQPEGRGPSRTVSRTRAQPPPDGNGRSGRPVIRDLLVTEEGLGVRARVVLHSEGQDLAGEATAAKTHKATLRAVARAGLAAVESLVGERARLELESLQVTDDGEDQQVVVSVTLVTQGGAEKLVGGAVVRGDDQTAALRAALDAINRRVTHAPAG